MRVILVPVANRPECVVALGATFAIARRLGVDVSGVHIRAYDRLPVAVPAEGWRQTLAMPSPWAHVSAADAGKASRAAADLFAEVAANAGYRLAKQADKDGSAVAVWHERLGTPEHVMPIIGPLADMVVVSRPPRTKGGGAKARIFLTEALLNAQRPVLVLPPKGTPRLDGHLAIAWNRSGEAARAVHAVLPLLKAAEKVTFLTVGRDHRCGPSAAEMAQFLRHHGIVAGRADMRDGDAGRGIEALYADVGADLLVMGAYSRPRVSELIFGGATEHMLTRAKIPVVMMHS